jgi:MFS family permease
MPGMEERNVANEGGKVKAADDECIRGVDKNHTNFKAMAIACGLSLCITVDILQYSMPLAFLPSVLEDRGHSPLKIATAIGVYYWTGFAGGALLTSYQIWCLVTGTKHEGVTTVATTRRWIVYLILCLGVGSVTLACQAYHPHWSTHTTCRFLQGFAGAFIFFYAFLLSVELFTGSQQIFAMTAASTALNIAEVLGSSLGASLYHYHGQRTVFWFLGAASVVNMALLGGVMSMIKEDPEATPPPAPAEDAVLTNGWKRLRDVLKSKRLGCAVVLITTSALIKGSVEEILPFHADHRWGMDPMEIGKLFFITAITYIVAAAVAGRMWENLGNYRMLFSSFWLAVLGMTSYGLFLIASYHKTVNTLYVGLGLYGICLGMTHTPAALLLADAVDHEEGKAKDAVNGIWNTMWEAGGSIGFLLGGLLAEDYPSQIALMAAYAIICLCCAGLMLAISNWPDEKDSAFHKAVAKAASYCTMEGSSASKNPSN